MSDLFIHCDVSEHHPLCVYQQFVTFHCQVVFPHVNIPFSCRWVFTLSLLATMNKGTMNAITEGFLRMCFHLF